METKEAKKIYFEWLETPKKLRQPKTRVELANNLGFSVASLSKWKGGKKYNSEIYLHSRTEDVDKALIEACCKKHNANAFRAYYQITDRLVDKSETKVKLELTADERARRLFQANRELREAGYRVAEVPAESTLLSEDLREDTG